MAVIEIEAMRRGQPGWANEKVKVQISIHANMQNSPKFGPQTKKPRFLVQVTGTINQRVSKATSALLRVSLNTIHTVA